MVDMILLDFSDPNTGIPSISPDLIEDNVPFPDFKDPFAICPSISNEGIVDNPPLPFSLSTFVSGGRRTGLGFIAGESAGLGLLTVAGAEIDFTVGNGCVGSGALAVVLCALFVRLDDGPTADSMAVTMVGGALTI